MKVRVRIFFALIVLFGCISAGCGRSYFTADSEADEAFQFVCDLELEPCDVDMAFYEYDGNGTYVEMEYEEIPATATKMRPLENQLSTAVLYEYLQAYVNEIDSFSVFLKENVCKVTDYKYEYVLKGTEGNYYLIPVIRFSIKDYGNVFLEPEHGCMIE